MSVTREDLAQSNAFQSLSHGEDKLVGRQAECFSSLSAQAKGSHSMGKF